MGWGWVGLGRRGPREAASGQLAALSGERNASITLPAAGLPCLSRGRSKAGLPPSGMPGWFVPGLLHVRVLRSSQCLCPQESPPQEHQLSLPCLWQLPSLPLLLQLLIPLFCSVPMVGSSELVVWAPSRAGSFIKPSCP